jgi:hypothetical protein
VAGVIIKRLRGDSTLAYAPLVKKTTKQRFVGAVLPTGSAPPTVAAAAAAGAHAQAEAAGASPAESSGSSHVGVPKTTVRHTSGKRSAYVGATWQSTAENPVRPWRVSGWARRGSGTATLAGGGGAVRGDCCYAHRPTRSSRCCRLPHLSLLQVQLITSQGASQSEGGVQAAPTRHSIGSFATEAQAAEAYDVAALRYRGPQTRINFPHRRAELLARAQAQAAARGRKRKRNHHKSAAQASSSSSSSAAAVDTAVVSCSGAAGSDALWVAADYHRASTQPNPSLFISWPCCARACCRLPAPPVVRRVAATHASRVLPRVLAAARGRRLAPALPPRGGRQRRSG